MYREHIHIEAIVKNVSKYSLSGRLRIASILDTNDKGVSYIGQRVTISGWSRTVRKQCSDTLVFVVLNDGSTSRNIQVVVEQSASGFRDALKSSVGCSYRITGCIVKSPAKEQEVELLVSDSKEDEIKVLGFCDPSKYPLAKKHHSKEFLREIPHLRPRTQFFSSVTRIRNTLSIAIHDYFQYLGFYYIQTPIITSADCEGAGEMFQVTTLLPHSNIISDIPTKKTGNLSTKINPESTDNHDKLDNMIDYNRDFFEVPTYLTVSGQLNVENFSCSMSDVYTFGPTFRAENSHTGRHLAEFWMIEPEMAFADLLDDMNLGEGLLKYCVEAVLKNNEVDLQYLDANIEKGLINRLKQVVSEEFARISYTEAIEMLKPYNNKFTVPVEWGMDLGSEHEKYITDVLLKKPCILYNYPKDIKAFYMKQNDDGLTVAAMDILVPKIGEVIGGSQREDDIEKLKSAIIEKGMELEPYWWYNELRLYGSVPHAGFGLGFERLVMMVTGIDNVRDVIPFPRYPGHCTF
ncbi:asparaginyl-tRNA synthetase family protein [Cryptosporidium muris RN66]|uniref:asparagine--tRNA ligase n=1 Tax=Cryptosporidium muris (strain RN66) TaxID=441375 RepID=B6AAM0_CRYMR|nr:asparaginyl-tRNA synthetase family protein [Cryptosporidium muris RN66]EEA05422.1 asparaginyl-tRNA synthetase family protein [Cryptosporidium muris RN66]|eukprot:XP_002139771.1 asparaginyl-tRNA synthetase family protein [Cryptosporidium muris RN66]